MIFRDKKVVIISGVVTLVLLFVTIVFAALTSRLNISFGNVTQNMLMWNVGFKGKSVTPKQEGTSTSGLSCGTASVTPSTVTVSDSELTKPGDKCIYSLVVENKGDLSASLSTISMKAPADTSCTKMNGSTMECGIISYKLIGADGDALTTGVTINKNEQYNIKLIIEYAGEEISELGVTQGNSSFTLTFNQVKEREGELPEVEEDGSTFPKCKRATTLHTEICSSSYCSKHYTSGSAITYGSLGTSGTLSSGDAFDCDVNGDGTYDSTTERFYYVSGLDGDEQSDYATLIYFTNTKEGEINHTERFQYNINNYNYLGPTEAYKQLPNTSQWSNVSLSNNGKRQIYAENGTTKTAGGNLPIFEYTGRAARLLDYREVNKACGITIGGVVGDELKNCKYLLEHTYYSDSSSNAGWYWLESPVSGYSNYVWYISGSGVFVGYTNNSFLVAVRPVIEVLKSDIDY